MSRSIIAVRGARQNNLRNLDVDLPLNELIVITGVSGSGKSSLAFDTIYSEGQRRYVETFSPYARQFLDRMDKPQVDLIEGIPPAIAIDQTNPVRTSRSTVGTMTELNDHLKLLFARVATPYCSRCGYAVEPDDAESVHWALAKEIGETGVRLLVTFRIAVPENFSHDEVEAFLSRQGYTRIRERDERSLEVVQDRFKLEPPNRARAIEAFEAAFKIGDGQLAVHVAEQPDKVCRFSSRLHCARCDIEYSSPRPNDFSFNSPLGACEQCRGFGRTMGIDYRLVVPDESKSLSGGAIKPFQTKTYRKYQNEMLRYAIERGIDVSKPWSELDARDDGGKRSGSG
jgi:excinuclease ABC subunit A